MMTGLTKVSFLRTLNRTKLQLDLPVVDLLAGFDFLPFIFGASLVDLEEFSKLHGPPAGLIINTPARAITLELWAENAIYRRL